METKFALSVPANARFLVPTRAEITSALGVYHFNDWMCVAGSVPAKFLADARGNIVYQPNGLPYIAPQSYQPSSFLQEVKNSNVGMFGFPLAGAFDLQRSWKSEIRANLYGFTNSLYSSAKAYVDLSPAATNRFVPAFTPVASWAVGYTGAARGYALDTVFLFAGGVNIAATITNINVDKGGISGNSQRNAINIESGYNYFVDENPFSDSRPYNIGVADTASRPTWATTETLGVTPIYSSSRLINSAATGAEPWGNAVGPWGRGLPYIASGQSLSYTGASGAAFGVSFMQDNPAAPASRNGAGTGGSFFGNDFGDANLPGRGNVSYAIPCAA